MKLSSTAKGIIKGIAVLSVVGFAIGVFFVPNIVFYGLGIVIGVVVSVLKVILLERAVDKVIGSEDKKQAQNTMRMGYMSRYLLTGLAMFATVFFMGLSGLMGVFVATLSLTISAYLVKFFGKK